LLLRLLLPKALAPFATRPQLELLTLYTFFSTLTVLVLVVFLNASPLSPL